MQAGGLSERLPPIIEPALCLLEACEGRPCWRALTGALVFLSTPIPGAGKRLKCSSKAPSSGGLITVWSYKKKNLDHNQTSRQQRYWSRRWCWITFKAMIIGIFPNNKGSCNFFYTNRCSDGATENWIVSSPRLHGAFYSLSVSSFSFTRPTTFPCVFTPSHCSHRLCFFRQLPSRRTIPVTSCSKNKLYGIIPSGTSGDQNKAKRGASIRPTFMKLSKTWLIVCWFIF